MHRELLQRWDERSGPKGSAKPSFDRLKNIEKPPVAPKKWLVCKRGIPSSYWGIANEFNIVQYVHWYRSCPCQDYPTLLNEVCKAHTDVAKWRDWKSKKFEHLSVNHERKVLKCDLEVSKIIKALEMMLDDHWIFWSSFENTLASNSTHCRVWKVRGLICFSRLEHVAAWWSTTIDYHHIPPPYSTNLHHIPPSSTMFPLPFGRVREFKLKLPTVKITILVPMVPMHHHAPRASSEVGRTKRTKRKCKPIIRSIAKHWKTTSCPKKVVGL